MKILSQLAIGTLLCATWQVSAEAALISLDNPTFGVGAITRDTNAGLDWLDVPLSQGRSFTDVAAQFGSGGDFEGFRHATLAELRSLVVDAGIPDINVIVTGDFTPFTTLIGLVGATDFQESNPETLGFVNDPVPLTEFRRSVYLDFFFLDNTPAYMAQTAASLNQTIVFPTVGHWLVRPVTEPPASVPEPNTVAGLLLVGVGAWQMRKKLASSVKT
jgi:hypothetical protein